MTNLQKRSVGVSAFILFPLLAAASDLTISDVELVYLRDTSKELSVKFTVQWNNAWHNEKNHDAAWMVIKFLRGENGYRHALIAEKGHAILRNNLSDGSNPIITVSRDKTGFFIYPGAKHRGPANWTVRIVLDPAILSSSSFSIWNVQVAVIGFEMVYIPEGAFTLGDPDTTSLRFGAFFRSDGEGKADGLIKIASEKTPMEIGKERGRLYYRVSGREQYEGDQVGPIPAEFPKGYQAFYIMKYELAQGQYAAFLNSLSGEQTQFRANFGGKAYYRLRGTIKIENDRYVAGAPNRPCNYLSWDDGCAFADWAALRPMTELEFTKACRGPSAPIPHEYPWGTSSKDNLMRVVPENDDLVMSNGLDEGQLTDKNREAFGASFYWVMDLAGSLWERAITVGHPLGRKFAGTHGDGQISWLGFATNDDWPKGDTEVGGFGFRGGGYYTHRQAYNEFNPHSPIAYRRYGAWSGGNRTDAYSSRFVRTAP
jgi:formylglycine-generating enzyme required for sulfatase activity